MSNTNKKEAILSSIPAQYFPLAIVVGTISTIATTYTLSTYQGHTAPFPHTDITHTARFTPERYVFRVGMLLMAAVMAWNWNMLYSWLRNVQQSIDGVQMRIKLAQQNHSTSDSTNNSVISAMLMMSPPSNHTLNIILYLGLGSCVAITISSMCITSNSDMPWTMHVIAASSFFVLCLVAQAMTTYKSYKLYKALNAAREEIGADESLAQSQIGLDTQNIIFMGKRSLYAKVAITLLSFGMLMVNILSSVVSESATTKSNSIDVVSAVVNAATSSGYDSNARFKSTTSNIVEWTCTLLIVIYNITFVFDWSSAKIMTSVGQVTPSQGDSVSQQQQHHHHRSQQPSYPQYSEYRMVPCRSEDADINGTASMPVARTVQQQQVYVFPNSTPSGNSSGSSLYPSTYSIQ